MEKLVCAACGAPLTIDQSKPVIICEYCDTSIENKFYVPTPKIEPAPQPETPVQAETELPEDEAEGGSLLKTLVGVGTAIAANRLRKRVSSAQQSAVRPVHPPRNAAVPRTRYPAAQVLRRGSESTVQTPRPSMPRPMGGMPSRDFGGRGHGGRGPGGHGGRGPGGRHR